MSRPTRVIHLETVYDERIVAASASLRMASTCVVNVAHRSQHVSITRFDHIHFSQACLIVTSPAHAKHKK